MSGGGGRPECARQDDDSAAVLLLDDLKRLFEDRAANRLSSAAIVAALAQMEDRPWSEWRHDKPITTRQVARLLKPFGARPRLLWIDDKTQRGYDRAELEDTFSRYLPTDPLGSLPHNDLDPLSIRKEDTKPNGSETTGNPRGSGILTDLTDDGEGTQRTCESEADRAFELAKEVDVLLGVNAATAWVYGSLVALGDAPDLTAVTALADRLEDELRQERIR